MIRGRVAPSRSIHSASAAPRFESGSDDGHDALVDEREIDAIPGQRQLGQSREDGPRHGSPGHRDGEARLTLQRLRHTHVKCGGRLGGDLITRHAASVAQPAASRRALMLSSPTRCASELAPTTQASR